MLKPLRRCWLSIVFVLVAYPYTSIAESGTPTAGQIWKEPVTGMEFVWVPGGCYEMGCGNWTSDCAPDEKPVHEVCVDGFWMGKTEVTQGQWNKVMGNNPSYFKGKGGNYPVEQVGWTDGKRFAKKLTAMNNGTFEFRFPTEAEWEYACRSGGKPEKYAGGSDLDQVAWYQGNSNHSTHAVATKAPNGLGLYDMSGNVFEWCEDSYHPTIYNRHQRNNPMYADDRGYQLDRGGSWNWENRWSRCASRAYVKRVNWITRSVGFRMVRNK
jgi:formylglycine-generating enzyme required for sulfatase activity